MKYLESRTYARHLHIKRSPKYEKKRIQLIDVIEKLKRENWSW